MSPGARGNSSTRPGAPWTLGQIMVAVLLSVVVAEPTSSTFTGNVWAYGMHRPSLTSLLLQIVFFGWRFYTVSTDTSTPVCGSNCYTSTQRREIDTAWLV